jgi:hypothetical protein
MTADEMKKTDEAIAKYGMPAVMRIHASGLEGMGLDGTLRLFLQAADEIESLGKRLSEAQTYAARRIEAAEAEVTRMAEALARERQYAVQLREALASIAANTCCDRCQEAAVVARAALAKNPVQGSPSSPIGRDKGLKTPLSEGSTPSSGITNPSPSGNSTSADLRPPRGTETAEGLGPVEVLTVKERLAADTGPLTVAAMVSADEQLTVQQQEKP